ncbi:hypothetical protein FB451DRAFT_1385470 [Mycena latifolia]|nr:hypothetical protein FB451DRAFT_1385470 [Mycena latifolia]
MPAGTRQSCAFGHSAHLYLGIRVVFGCNSRRRDTSFGLRAAPYPREDLGLARAKSQAPRPVLTACYVGIVANVNTHGVRKITRQNTPARPDMEAESSALRPTLGARIRLTRLCKAAARARRLSTFLEHWSLGAALRDSYRRRLLLESGAHCSLPTPRRADPLLHGKKRAKTGGRVEGVFWDVTNAAARPAALLDAHDKGGGKEKGKEGGAKDKWWSLARARKDTGGKGKEGGRRARLSPALEFHQPAYARASSHRLGVSAYRCTSAPLPATCPPLLNSPNACDVQSSPQSETQPIAPLYPHRPTSDGASDAAREALPPRLRAPPPMAIPCPRSTQAPRPAVAREARDPSQPKRPPCGE